MAPHQLYNYDIPLLSGYKPPAYILRNYSHDKLRVIKKYLKENLFKGWIRASKSLVAAPVLLVKKLGGGI